MNKDNQAAEQSTLTSKEDFELFKAGARRWLKYFGLMGWAVDFAHEDMEGCGAHVRYSVKDRSALMDLNTDLREPPTRELLDRLAFHEVCELMLARVYFIGLDAEVEDALGEAQHEVIRILENVVWQPPKPEYTLADLIEMKKPVYTMEKYLMDRSKEARDKTVVSIWNKEPKDESYKPEIGGEW